MTFPISCQKLNYVYPKEALERTQEAWERMFVALVIIVKWEKHRKRTNVHVMDYYAAVKKNEARLNDMGSFPSHNCLMQIAKKKISSMST